MYVYESGASGDTAGIPPEIGGVKKHHTFASVLKGTSFMRHDEYVVHHMDYGYNLM